MAWFIHFNKKWRVMLTLLIISRKRYWSGETSDIIKIIKLLKIILSTLKYIIVLLLLILYLVCRVKLYFEHIISLNVTIISFLKNIYLQIWKIIPRKIRYDTSLLDNCIPESLLLVIMVGIRRQ
jgi:hypothetical protein